MKKSSKKKSVRLELVLKIFLALIVIMSVVRFALDEKVSVVADQNGDKSALNKRMDFAKCLMEKGWIMYGVNTCEYCQQQKKMFGQAFERIKYIDCNFEQRLCQDKNITYYPVWEHQNKLVPGLQSLANLAQASGCEI